MLCVPVKFRKTQKIALKWIWMICDLWNVTLIPFLMCPLAALLFGILSLVLQDGVILQYCFREYQAEYQCNNSSRVSRRFRRTGMDSCLTWECRTAAPLSMHDKKARRTHWGAGWCWRTSVSVKTSTSKWLILIVQCVSESHLSGKVSNFKKKRKKKKKGNELISKASHIQELH